jgi:hypothetical protein
MKRNYIWDSINTKDFKGDKPIQRKKIKRAKIKKPHKVKYKIITRRKGIWNIPDNF